MHHQGAPEVMQQDPRYDDVLVEVYQWLEERIAAAEAAGIDRARILIDPGFGFGKSVAHNLELMNGLALLHSLGCPLVVGASRKRTIGALSNEAPADKRVGGSIAFALKAAEQGAQILRVHDVFETVQALQGVAWASRPGADSANLTAVTLWKIHAPTKCRNPDVRTGLQLRAAAFGAIDGDRRPADRPSARPATAPPVQAEGLRARGYVQDCRSADRRQGSYRAERSRARRSHPPRLCAPFLATAAE